MAQDSTETGKHRGPGRPFPPGVSGNPGGRPRGLVGKIRDETHDGEELVEYVLSVFRNETAKSKDRMEAVTWLADRGFGRPIQTIDTPSKRTTIFRVDGKDVLRSDRGQEAADAGRVPLPPTRQAEGTDEVSLPAELGGVDTASSRQRTPAHPAT